MIYTLYYGDYDYIIEQTEGDIIDFEFIKRFGHPRADGFLTAEEKQFEHELDHKWFCNQLNERDYYTTRNYDFINFLKDKYEEEAREYFESEDNEESYFDPDDWWANLDYDTKEELMATYYAR